MPRIDEFFSTKELLNYFRARTAKPMLGEGLFPSRKIQDIEFNMITGSGGLPVSASIHALDSATEMASRQALEKGAAALALIKRQIKIGEKELIKINSPRNDAEFQVTLSELYNDAEKMVEGVNVRVEAMRMEVLSSGKLAINENGVAVTLDYGIPTENKKSFDWTNTSTSKPLDDLDTLATAIETTSGVRPTRALTSRKILKAICNNTSVRKAIFGTNSDKIVTQAQLNDLLAQMDLPQIAVYEEKYKVETASGYTTKRYFPDTVISMFSDNSLGETIFGLTAEEVKLIGDGQMDEASMVGNVFVGKYSSVDPVGEFTKAAGTALPTLPHGEEVGIGTITC